MEQGAHATRPQSRLGPRLRGEHSDGEECCVLGGGRERGEGKRTRDTKRKKPTLTEGCCMLSPHDNLRM